MTAGKEIEWNKLDVAKCSLDRYGINKNVAPFAPDIDKDGILTGLYVEQEGA